MIAAVIERTILTFASSFQLLSSFSFLRKHGYTSVGMTFLVAAFVIQWYHLCAGFWENVFGHEWHKIPLSIETFVKGDFAAGSVLIAFGAILGKVNPPQLMFMAIIQVRCFLQ